MFSIKKFFPLLILLCITIAFYYKFFFLGLIPFPGDFLVGNYEPYKSEIIGVPNKGQGADVVRELYPWKFLSIQSLKEGEFPLWNPYVFSGNTLFANLQSSILHPTTIFFLALPFVDAWAFYIVLQQAFLLITTFIYLREIKLGKIPSIFGASAFAFSSFLTVWTEYGVIGHTLVFLPLSLFSIEKILKKQKWYWYLLLVSSGLLSIFSGYIQIALYSYILCGLYVGSKFLRDRKNKKTYISIFLGIGLSFFLSAIQLVPLYEVVSLSLRSNYSYEELLRRLLPLESIVTFFAPDFFGNPATRNYFLHGGSILESAISFGLWPFIFMVFAIFSRKNLYIVFFSCVATLTFISSLSLPPFAYLHSIGIPVLSTGIPTRVLSIFVFSAAVLAAFGLEGFIKTKVSKKNVLTLFLVGCVFCIFWIVTSVSDDPNLAISKRNLILPTLIFILGSFAFLLKRIKANWVALIFTLLTLFELFYSFQKFNSFVPKKYMYPETDVMQKLRSTQTIYRSWGYGSAVIEPNFQIMEKTFTPDGYDALYQRRYGEFIAASNTGKFPQLVSRTVAQISSGYGPSGIKDSPAKKRALDLVGVGYVLNKNENGGFDSAFNESQFNLIWEKGDWQIYENKNVLPRISMFGRYQVISNDSKAIEKLYEQNFDFKNILIVEQDLPGEFSIKEDPSATASGIMYLSNKITFKTTSEYDQLVFLSDNFYPGWEAYVDGVRTPIYRANYTFRAIPVKKGEHDIIINYEPESFRLGLYISGISFVLLIFYLYYFGIKKNA